MNDITYILPYQVKFYCTFNWFSTLFLKPKIFQKLKFFMHYIYIYITITRAVINKGDKTNQNTYKFYHSMDHIYQGEQLLKFH